MNLKEMQRITVLPLPSYNEKDQKTINYKIISCIEALHKRDEDKEKRLRALENNVNRGNSIARDIILVTADYVISGFYNDRIIVSNTAANTNIQFPPATGSRNMIIVKNFGTGIITVNAIVGETIDENPNQTVLADEGIVFVDYARGVWLVI